VNPISGFISAAFLGMDSATQGNWKSVYNYHRVTIIGDTTSNPNYATVLVSKQNYHLWDSSTSDIRALSKISSPGRVAANWSSTSSFYIDISFADQATHQIAIYCLDWNKKGRAETIKVFDARTNALLDTRSVSNFTKGVYLQWNVSGHVRLQITKTAGGSAVISGLFIN
jgi:hypothetical protein